MSDNRYTLYGIDGRYESVNRMPEPKLPGDRVEGPHGRLTWTGHVWAVQEVVDGMEADFDDKILAGLMRRMLDPESEVYTDLRHAFIIDGSISLTDEEAEVVQKLLPDD